MPRSVLVALDGSAYSEPATTLALDWAARFGARLLGLGVLDEPAMSPARCGVPLGASSCVAPLDGERTSRGCQTGALRRIFTNPDYDFIGRRRWAYAVSVALMLLALGSVVVKGLRRQRPHRDV